MDYIFKEEQRQNNELCLIASENIVSKAIRQAQGSVFTNKYSEGYPGYRYYKGNEIIDEVENQAISLACSVFDCKYANVQPHSGSQANQAVYLALLKPGDIILGMDLNAGGHLTHGSKVSFSGKIYNSITYGLDENGIINYKEIEQKLYEFNPKLLVIGASAYSRLIDYEKIKFIVDSHDGSRMRDYLIEHPDTVGQELIDKFRTYIMVDMAHIAGLVAARVIPSPIPYANVVTTTTHKTLRGPRGGLILTNDADLAKKIDKAVFPGIQGGPLDHVILAKAICFDEALQPEFREYGQNILNNMKAIEEVLRVNNIKMVSNGTDNHLILIDLRDKNITGKLVENYLAELHIIVNRNAVVNDPLSKSETSGIRIGVANLTTRGLNTEDCAKVGLIISEVINELSIGNFDSKKKSEWINTINDLTTRYPIYR